ncbi:MAG TPA: stress-responsive transcriptional regulator [Cytophagales bacterium]|nr:stress-responsive transcriptional regulator [Cytophagales bacterium]HAA22152.1 stress-responsive transcriptional regulator [Cytophagales bacterium]HAP63503.1 stress-responsive transcriptional regulator [Cytophagales bacterium]
MQRKLTRDANQKVLAGVCAGLARYFGWKVEYTRLGYLALSILSAGFPGILVYIILWVVMPEE